MEQIIDTRDRVSSFLKEADTLIKSKKYDTAMELVLQAKSLDPTNPYVQAFFDRIEHFRQKPVNQDPTIDIDAITAMPPVQANIEIPKSDIDENKLRAQIEKEYQVKFKDELQKIEKALIKRIETERIRFDNEKNEIKKKYEDKLREAQSGFSKDNQTKIESELISTEQRLRDQFNAEQAFLENEMKQRLENEFKSKLESSRSEIEQKFNKLIEQEKQTSLEHEKLLKQEYEQKLKTEIDSFKAENNKLKKEELVTETKLIAERLTQEYNSKLDKQLAATKEFYENEKLQLQQQIGSRQKELEEQTQRILAIELHKIKDRENTEFEKKRKALEENLRTELTTKLSSEFEEVKNRLDEEYNHKLQNEKINFEKLKEEFVAQENSKIDNIRSTLKKEMELKCIHKLESIQEQFTKAYDDKMELLGVYVPDALEDKLRLYKKRLTEFWSKGQPSVEQARKLMGLKELLDLSFEDHTQLEMDVRIELYISKIEESIKNKKLDPTKQTF